MNTKQLFSGSGVCAEELMSKACRAAQMFMQECRLTILVNWRREARGELGYYPSCSLPMRIGRAGAEKTDCFAALVISAETYSGMFFICAEAAAAPGPAPLTLNSGRAHYWRGLGGSGPKQPEQTALTTSPPHSLFTLLPCQTLSSFSLQWGSPVCRYSHAAAGWKKKKKRVAKQGLVFHY